ncbi:hypothetical protein EIM50_24130, partial [Pseudoxanthomonas sp. SGD-10]
MKKNIYFIIIGWLCLLQSVSAQTSETITWQLLSNANGVAAGGLTAESQRLGSAIAGITYGNGNFNLGTGFQRVATATGKQLPVAYDENSYVEYRMAVPVGKKFQL